MTRWLILTVVLALGACASKGALAPDCDRKITPINRVVSESLTKAPEVRHGD